MSPFIHEAVPHRSKRVRFSHEPSSPISPSARSALASTDATDDATTTNARDDGTADSDSSSMLSESSEEPSSDESSSEEDDDDDDDNDNEDTNENPAKDTEMALEEPKGTDGVINLRANRGKKPIMKLSEVDMGPDIRGFLKDFLPQLKAANEELMAQKRAGTLRKLDDEQDQEEGAPYIEMDLGLGVLEEKDPNANSESDTDSDADMGDAVAEEDVLGKLMGREKKMDSAGIEEIPNTTSS